MLGCTVSVAVTIFLSSVIDSFKFIFGKNMISKLFTVVALILSSIVPLMCLVPYSVVFVSMGLPLFMAIKDKQTRKFLSKGVCEIFYEKDYLKILLASLLPIFISVPLYLWDEQTSSIFSNNIRSLLGSYMVTFVIFCLYLGSKLLIKNIYRHFLSDCKPEKHSDMQEAVEPTA